MARDVNYDDSQEAMEELLECLCVNLDRFCAKRARMLYWFDMRHYRLVVEKLSAQWTVAPHPLIWDRKSQSPSGDNLYGYRHAYETALFCIRGEPVPTEGTQRDAIFAHTPRLGNLEHDNKHPSEKRIEVLEHFLTPLVNEYTHILDPTCGGGTALEVACALGAARATGLEVNPEYYALALRRIDAKNP